MPKRVDRPAKRQDIGAAAIRVFRQRGYHHTRMADIAEAAHVGKGTLYEYFENKADILHLAFDEYLGAFKTGAVAAMESVDTPAARLLALIRFALGHAGEWEDHCAVYVDYLGTDRSAKDEAPIWLEDIYGEMRALLRGLLSDGKGAGEIRDDLDPDATAELLLTIFDGIVLHSVLDTPECKMTTVHQTALKIMGRGILVGPFALDVDHPTDPV
jgi:AcrR family transcriptional regulator